MAEGDKRKEEIEQSRSDEMALRPKAARDAAEERRNQKRIIRAVQRVQKTGDTRAFSMELKRSGVSEDSDVWKKAWELYRDSLRRK